MCGDIDVMAHSVVLLAAVWEVPARSPHSASGRYRRAPAAGVASFYPRISFLGFLRPVSAASRNRVTLRSPFRAAAMILLIMTS